MTKEKARVDMARIIKKKKRNKEKKKKKKENEINK